MSSKHYFLSEPFSRSFTSVSSWVFSLLSDLEALEQAASEMEIKERGWGIISLNRKGEENNWRRRRRIRSSVVEILLIIAHNPLVNACESYKVFRKKELHNLISENRDG